LYPRSGRALDTAGRLAELYMRQIGASIVAAPISMLDADFVFIALPGHGNQFVTELARSSPKLDPANLQRVQKKLQQERATLGSGREFMIADVSGGSGLRVMTAPIFRPVERHMATERTVYVLDDDDAVLRSLERLLSSANFKPITFDHPSVFLTAAKTFKTGCVLLDVRLPGMSGLEVQAQLLKMRSDLAIIVVTGQGDIQTAVRAMKAGAADFIEKPYGDEALLGSIEAALRRETDLDIADAVRRVAALSTREREVLDGLLAGRANKLIAYDLGISVRTVEVHRARMMERLGLRQLSEVIRVGVMARLSVSPPANTRMS
jgi:two-component system, LuxR family, response regulator FixJ